MKKIAIIGLIDYENYGDQFIGKTVNYLSCLNENIETRLLDISIHENRCGACTWLLRCFRKLARLLKINNAYTFFNIKVCRSLYKNNLFKQLKDVEGIVFAGGSFKFGTQDLWMQYSLIIEFAEKNNIPVMFDAMNIQKYDGNDYRCRYLKKHLNYDCVKYFTSRDGKFGVDRLNKYYVENSNLIVKPAADPAFWIPETYNVEKQNSTLIGINVIAPDRFLLYGGNLEPSIVKEAYLQLFRLLDKSGYDWELFTNGMKDDNEFLYELVDIYEDKQIRYIIPSSDIHLVQIEANYCAVFGARLHSMICAYSLAIPVAGFIWDEKIVHFAEMAKIERFFLPESMVSGENMFEVLMNAINNEDDKANRELWKATTKETISDFLNNYCKLNNI